jgi:hypothetical protein
MPDPILCATCGRALTGDPDEDPTGDAGQPICGECARERDFFVLDIADGELDGRLDDDSDETVDPDA